MWLVFTCRSPSNSPGHAQLWGVWQGASQKGIEPEIPVGARAVHLTQDARIIPMKICFHTADSRGGWEWQVNEEEHGRHTVCCLGKVSGWESCLAWKWMNRASEGQPHKATLTPWRPKPCGRGAFHSWVGGRDDSRSWSPVNCVSHASTARLAHQLDAPIQIWVKPQRKPGCEDPSLGFGKREKIGRKTNAYGRFKKKKKDYKWSIHENKEISLQS